MLKKENSDGVFEVNELLYVLLNLTKYGEN